MAECFSYFLDITSACNLRCPTCPHGQKSRQGFKPAVMPVELFQAIVEKIRSETPCPETYLHLYNWGEATLHPELPRFIEIARAAGLPPNLSSNLAHPRDLTGMVRARPRSLRISLSGNYPQTYGVTHFPGSIWMVKSNAYRLRALMEQHQIDFHVEFFFHQYRGQTDDLERVRALAKELSFRVIAAWAFLMPLERLLEFAAGSAGPEEEALLQRFRVDPRQALRVSRQQRERFQDCPLRSHSMAINADGTVGLCCATYDQTNQAPRSFLDLSHEEIQAWRYRHPLCEQCQAQGADIYYGYGAQKEIEEGVEHAATGI